MLHNSLILYVNYNLRNDFIEFSWKRKPQTPPLQRASYSSREVARQTTFLHKKLFCKKCTISKTCYFGSWHGFAHLGLQNMKIIGVDDLMLILYKMSEQTSKQQTENDAIWNEILIACG